MTICIGMLAQDGLVIAADALESGDYLNRSVQKIMTWISTQAGNPRRQVAACVIAGAGNSGFIDAFTSELLSKIDGAMTIKDFEAYARETLEIFYSKHVTPLLAAGDYDFSTLIGAAFGIGPPRLFQTYASTLKPVMELSTAIGGGAPFAKQFDDYFPFADVRHAEVSAAAIISRTKECVPGCGKHTDIVSLHGPQIAPMKRLDRSSFSPLS